MREVPAVPEDSILAHSVQYIPIYLSAIIVQGSQWSNLTQQGAFQVPTQLMVNSHTQSFTGLSHTQSYN